MDIENLRSQLRELHNLAGVELGKPLFTSRWTQLEMHLVCYESKYKRFGKALAYLHTQSNLPNTEASMRSLKFILLNTLSMLKSNRVKSRAYPGSAETIRKWKNEDSSVTLTETFITVIDTLCEYGYLEKISGAAFMRTNVGSGPKLNRFYPTERLLDEVIVPFNLLSLPLEWNDTGNYVKVIQVHEYRHNFSRRQELPLVRFRGSSEKTIIKDSNEFLRAYNRGLRKFKISVSEGVLPDDARRTIYRIFCRGSEEYGKKLECGGRLYGGFWQQLPSEKKGLRTGERPHRGNILINDKPTVELDYSALHINMLYARLGRNPFEGDAYAIANWPRRLVKACILTALNCENDNPNAAMKYVREHDDDELRGHYGLLLRGGYSRLIADFIAVHPLLAQFLHSDVGIGLQRQDSEIAMLVIHKMATMVGAPVLPIHDSFIAPARVENELSMCMIGAFENVMGTRRAPLIKRS